MKTYNVQLNIIQANGQIPGITVEADEIWCTEHKIEFIRRGSPDRVWAVYSLRNIMGVQEVQQVIPANGPSLVDLTSHGGYGLSLVDLTSRGGSD